MGRAPCCDKDGLKKGPWTPEEDQKLTAYIQKHGYGSWRTLPKSAGLSRCGKSCRLRWTNYLRPDIKRGRFSFEEEETIIQLHSILGNKWSAIAARLPGRTDNEIKNYWNTHIRKRLLCMGIDPVTHTPRLDLLDVSNLLGIHQFINPEFLKIATSLIPSINNSQFLQDQPFQFSNPSHQFYNNDQPQLWQVNGMQCNLLPATTTTASATMSYENMEQSVLLPQFVSDNTTFYLPKNQNCSISTTNSILSTPASSPSLTTQLNCSSTYINSCSTTAAAAAAAAAEDERESYCSELFKFNFADVLDVSEFL